MPNYKARGTICLRIDGRKSVALFTPTASSTVEGRKAKRALFLSSVLYDEAPVLPLTKEQQTAPPLTKEQQTAPPLTKEQQTAIRTVLMALSLTTEQQTELTTALANVLSLTTEQQQKVTAALTPSLLSLSTEQRTALTGDSDNDVVQKRLDDEGNVILQIPTGACRIEFAAAVANAGKSLVEVEVSRASEDGELTLEGFR